MTIIVSAYFKIPSKASHEFYLPHLQRFLGGIHGHIVFFTTNDLKPMCEELRGSLPITFVVLDTIYDMVAFKKYGRQFWLDQCNLDVEKYHTPEVAAVWYNKKEFVKQAIEIVGDDSVPYIWCDAGCVRDNAWLPIIHTFGYNTERIPKDKLMVQCFGCIPNQRFFKYPDSYLAGAIIAGYKDTWIECSDLYDLTLLQYVEAKITCNSDQNIWTSAIVQYPSKFLCVVVADFINKWFYFLKYLSL